MVKKCVFENKKNLNVIFVYYYIPDDQVPNQQALINNFLKVCMGVKELIMPIFVHIYLAKKSRNLVVLEKSHSRLFIIRLQTYLYFISDY